MAPTAGQTTTRSSPLAGPFLALTRSQSAAAALMVLATAVALLWANSPWSASYDTFWHTELAIRVAGAELSLDLQHWVNDGLMVFFFFVVGLEVKRELTVGELTDRQRAAVPAVAALTGLLVPALLYLAVNPSGEAARAWGVVISTDTAFLLGVLVLVGPACPGPLRVFLLTLAVADDVGALSIIALFYTEDLRPGPLALSALGIAVMVALRPYVWRGPPYFVLAVLVWVAMEASGVHPTIAGVVIALFAPSYPPRPEEVGHAVRLTRAFSQSPGPELGRAARLAVDRAVPATDRLQRLWEPWTSLVVVPVFALANAGVTLTSETVDAALESPVTWGIVAGLVLGKPIGILLGVVLAVRLRWGTLAGGLGWYQLAGGAALSGIGFTISLFIVDLAFTDERLADQARIGVLAASALATALGTALFRLGRRLGDGGGDPERPVLLDRPVDPARDHVRGPVDAPLTLVEYGDFECPFCGRATGAVEEVRAHFGDRLRYVFRHLPLTDVHPHAQLAAEAAEAAATQGRFWELHDLLFRQQDRLALPEILAAAAALDLSVEQLADEVTSGAHRDRVEEDVESAYDSGVRGTPTFFVGERRYTGETDADSLIAALEAAARAVEAPAPR